MQFTISYQTIPEVADSDFLDRLADLVYEIEQLGDPVLSLNDDGSITASFEIEGEDAVAAVDGTAGLFFDAFVQARPLRMPLREELEDAGLPASRLAASVNAAPVPVLA